MPEQASEMDVVLVGVVARQNTDAESPSFYYRCGTSTQSFKSYKFLKTACLIVRCS